MHVRAHTHTCTHTHSERRGKFVQRAIVLLPLVDSVMRGRTGAGSKILSSVLANLNTSELEPIGGKMCKTDAQQKTRTTVSQSQGWNGPTTNRDGATTPIGRGVVENLWCPPDAHNLESLHIAGHFYKNH